MPFGIHKHSNRSKSALSDFSPTAPSSSASASPLVPKLDEAVRPPVGPPPTTTTSSPQLPQTRQRNNSSSSTSKNPLPPSAQQQQPVDTATALPSAAQPRARTRNGLPARSQSVRYSSPLPLQSPFFPARTSADDLQLNLADPLQEPGRRKSHAVVDTKKSRSIFDRMRSGTSRGPEQKVSTSEHNTRPTGRRASTQHDNPNTARLAANNRYSLDPSKFQDWHGVPSTRSQLTSPQEGAEEEGGSEYFNQNTPDFERSQQRSAAQPHLTIRPVPTESDSQYYSAVEDRDQFQQFQEYAIQQQSESLAINPAQAVPYPPPQENYSQNPQFVNQQYQRLQNAETVSQLSYDSPIDPYLDQRPISVQSNEPSPIGSYSAHHPDDYQVRTPVQATRPESSHLEMTPPAGAPPPQQQQQAQQQQIRRSAENNKNMQGPQQQQESLEAPPGYRREFSNAGTAPPTPGATGFPPGSGAQGGNYRGGPPQRDQFPQGGGEQGRNTPPPTTSTAAAERDLTEAHKELAQKYKKVKSLYFDKVSQVEQLQNTLANQRMSQSRTSLDDSEYMNRFQRLDGAIINLAFNIRKDWRALPPWLVQWVNQDAIKTGKQEMTAVGRAYITRFLLDEVFNRSFHPGLDIELSTNLKVIEHNIRRFSPIINNQEESDALTAKVVHWRLATVEGLKDALNAPQSEQFRDDFTRMTTSNLTANLIKHLKDPIPGGIEDTAYSIVAQAVSIASNIPLESRDISIIYPMPGELVNGNLMRVEGGVPMLENPGDPSDGDSFSDGSMEKDENGPPGKEKEKDGHNVLKKDKPKQGGGMLSAMIGNSNANSRKQSVVSVPVIQGEGGAGAAGAGEAKGKVSSGDGQKVRFAGFVGVEVRGRQILAKAPIWAVN